MIIATAKEATERVSLFELFSAAEPIDILFMTLGVIGGIITGLSLPFFNVLFGRILDKLNQNPSKFLSLNNCCDRNISIIQIHSMRVSNKFVLHLLELLLSICCLDICRFGINSSYPSGPILLPFPLDR